jgi:uncharacterized membrane protein
MFGTGLGRAGVVLGLGLGGFADGIVLHPTYEGKVVRYLDEHRPSWWTRRDGSTALWIVGGPIG